MPSPSDYVTPGSGFAEQAEQMSGSAPASAGMAPYPLYGLPPLGQEPEAVVPFYKRPLFCYGVGTAAGFGLGYLIFGVVMPRMGKKKPKRNSKKKDESQ